MVDASKIVSLLSKEVGGKQENFEIAKKQLYCGDVVLVNKTDVQDIPIETLQAFNTDATFYKTEYAKIELQKILDLNAFTPQKTLQRLLEGNDEKCTHPTNIHPTNLSTACESEKCGKSRCEKSKCGKSEEKCVKSDEKSVIHGIESITCKFDKDCLFHLPSLELLLANILWEESGMGTVLRAKGIFNTTENELFALQSVGETFELLPVFEGKNSSYEEIEPKFLFLGEHIKKDRFLEKLRECIRKRGG